MAHGYYNLKGEFVTTSSREAATDAWRSERGYSTGGVYDVGGGETVDTRQVARERESAPATPAPTQSTATDPYVQNLNQLGISLPGQTTTPTDDSLVRATSGYGATAPDTPELSYDVQGIQSLGTEPTSEPFYDVQSIQSQRETSRFVSEATPTEQAAGQGGGTPEEVLPYFADVGSGTQYLYSQWPDNVGGVGTPTELRAGGGYGPSSYQWSESPASLAELQQGRTPVGPALAAATTVETFLTEFGVRPGFVTPFVSQSLGLSATDMQSMGYIQDLYGQWIALDFGEAPLAGGGGSGGTGGDTGGGYGGGGGGGGGGGYNSPANFRSGYTSGLINWRVGFS